MIRRAVVGGGSFAAVAAATVADDDDDRPFVRSVSKAVDQPASQSSVSAPAHTHIISVLNTIHFWVAGCWFLGEK